MSKTKLSRRQVLHTAMAAAVGIAAPVRAAQWPTKHIDLIVPWPAGGASDLTIRLLAESMERSLGQPVIVRNKPGAGGTLVAPTLKDAAPTATPLAKCP